MRVLTCFCILFHGCGAGEAWIGGLAFSGLWGWGVGLAGCVQGRGLGARAPRLPTFILLISFSNIV